MKKRILAAFMTVALLTAAFSGTALAWDGWDIVDGNWCYYQNDQIVTGWLAMNGTWYYMDPVSGAVQTGWVYVDGSWYYMDDSGAMLTGWQNVNGTWYYMYDSGAMATGWVYVDGAWYYMYDSGAMATGWLQIVVDQVETLDGRVIEISDWYYLSGSGAMATGWVYSGDTWYYMGANGVLQYGWVQSGNDWYWMTEYGMLRDTWLSLVDTEFDGRPGIADYTYYYLKQDGTMACNETLDIFGETCTFGASGAVIGIPNAVKVPINFASVEHLMQLPGIGEVLAQKIVDYRENHGMFTDITQLMNVNGIGEGRFAAIKDYIILG